MQRTISSLEVLESRIAPATLSGQVLHYTDEHGQAVTVTISKGTLAATDFTFNNAFGSTGDQQLELIDIHSLTDAGGADITVTVAKSKTGTGQTAIGLINASGIDLGKVSIQGDLGSIEAGSNGASNIAIASLKLGSYGIYGSNTQVDPTSPTASAIGGKLGSLIVTGNVANNTLGVNDTGTATNSSIGSITVGGSILNDGEITSAGGGIGKILVKGSLVNSGEILSASGTITGVTVLGGLYGGGAVQATTGDIGPVSVAGSIDSGGAVRSVAGAIGKVTVGGSISDGGTINAHGNIGITKVGGDMTNGGSIQSNSGVIAAVTVAGQMSTGSNIETQAGGSITSVTIGHTVDSASIQSAGSLGKVTIKGNLNGRVQATGSIDSVTVDGSMSDNGQIQAGTTLGSVQVKVAGNDLSIQAGGDITKLQFGALSNGRIHSSNGAIGLLSVSGYMTDDTIEAHTNIAAIVVGGSISANTQITTDGGNLSSVKVKGEIDDININVTGDIGPISVGHSVTMTGITSTGTLGAFVIKGALQSTNITTGGDIASVTVGASVIDSNILAGTHAASTATITVGAVKVKGDWIASNLSAGVEGSGSSNSNYGEVTDTLVAADSSITSIAIGGTVQGAPSDPMDGIHYGFDAKQIGKFSYGKLTVSLPVTTPANIDLDPVSHTIAIELV